MKRYLKKGSIQNQEVGVLLLGYSRPELLEKRIYEISQSKISNFIVSIDGGEKSHTVEMDNFKKTAQKLFSNSNFELRHHSQNLGLVKHVTGEISRVLQKNKYVIVIEDDVKVSNSFVENMIRGLDILNTNKCLGIVSGYSPLFNSKFKNKWRKTHICFLWGWACSRESWDYYDFNIANRDIDKELFNSKKWLELNKFQKNFWANKIRHSQKNPLYTWDHQLIFHSFTKNFVNLTPIFSIVGNEGFNDMRAVHTRGEKPKNINNFKINDKLIGEISNFSRFYSILDFDNYFTAIKFKLIITYKNKIKKRFLQYP